MILAQAEEIAVQAWGRRDWREVRFQTAACLLELACVAIFTIKLAYHLPRLVKAVNGRPL